ncbi:MAG: DUF1223 domain-containing protein [Dechloromonas sp.]|nr:DUF1223 domain-containing protein [Dechloromonas sp.]
MNKPSFTSLLSAALLTALAPVATGAECSARSGEHTVPLLELFTSEGCSSCPPADRLLSEFRVAGSGAGPVVPLALHVDYWDYIGWKDAFAHPGFAARQRRQAAQAGKPVVYTPQFFVQGKPYGATPAARALQVDLERVHGQAARADLVLTIGPAVRGSVPVTIDARLRESPAGGRFGLFVALYENGLTTRVGAGENRGRTLHHDFVVRQWAAPQTLPENGRIAETTHLALAPDARLENLGVATFIQNLQSGEVIQALAHGVCE